MAGGDKGNRSGSPIAVNARERERSAGGAGLAPAGGSQTRKQRRQRDQPRRLLNHQNHAPARKEEAHGGTRGSSVIGRRSRTCSGGSLTRPPGNAGTRTTAAGSCNTRTKPPPTGEPGVPPFPAPSEP